MRCHTTHIHTNTPRPSEHKRQQPWVAHAKKVWDFLLLFANQKRGKINEKTASDIWCALLSFSLKLKGLELNKFWFAAALTFALPLFRMKFNFFWWMIDHSTSWNPYYYNSSAPKSPHPVKIMHSNVHCVALLSSFWYTYTTTNSHKISLLENLHKMC
jgi:hypothetical protein